jgi:AcrR family transcriptional regulator
MVATSRRIVAAAVAILADQGPAATTYAGIAARARVSVPTVYKHFPRHGTLLAHCEAAVSAAAPRIDEAAITDEPDLDQRLGLLVDALCERHAYFAPWRQWDASDADARVLEDLIRAALAPAFNGKVPRPPLAVAAALLGFAGWQELTRMLPDAAAVKRAASGAMRALFARRDGA